MNQKTPADAGLKTFKVPVVKMISTYAYIKCKDAETAKKMIEDKPDVVMINGDVEEQEGFRLGDVGDDMPL